MRSLYVLFAALLVLFFAGSAEAATSTTARALSISTPTSGVAAAIAVPGDDQLFAAQPVADEALAATHGTSLSRGFVRGASASYATSTFQQAGSVTRIAMDNWFHDVGDPLIASQLARPISFV